MTEPLKIMFTVREIYYTQIVDGTKTAEVRRASDYWKSIAHRAEHVLMQNLPVTAVFVCGRKPVHRRRVLSVEWFETAKEALGRDPSEQGKLDIGEDEVYRFNLAEVIP